TVIALFSSYSIFIFFQRISSFITSPPSTAIYTLSLHDALPISYHLSYGDVNAIRAAVAAAVPGVRVAVDPRTNGLLITGTSAQQDRKSTRLNSSHQIISYAVFCLKKKK